LGSQFLAIDEHREAGEGRPFGQGEDIEGLEAIHIAVVDKDLIDFGGGYLILNVDGDIMVLDGHVHARRRNDDAVSEAE